jgi:hypothetical protein
MIRDFGDLSLGRLYYTSRGFDLLAFVRKCNYLFTNNKITKQLAFLIISSSPSLKNIIQNFKPLVLVESIYFHHFLPLNVLKISTFDRKDVPSLMMRCKAST